MKTVRQILSHFGGACFGAGLLASCSSANEPIATSFSRLAPTPIAAATGSRGRLTVAVYTTPTQPPPPAESDGVELVITDAATGAPVEGLTISMTPWMPAMGHGTCCTPVFTDNGGGRYVSTAVSLFMPGEWQLRTEISSPLGGANESLPAILSDFVAPTFDVP